MNGTVAALLAALFWALSVPILNHGLKRVSQRGVIPVLSGLQTSLTVGALMLGLIFLVTWRPVAGFNGWLVLGGALTFPIGTGFYYLCGFGFHGRIESAAQFTKIKPLFSLVLAVLFLNESLSAGKGISLIFILAGGVFLAWHARKGKVGPKAVIAGLSMALSWAIGEIAMAMGLKSTDALAGTFLSLVSGVAIAAVLFAALRPKEILSVWQGKDWKNCALPFVAHGVLSFAFAYYFFFCAIDDVGVGRTVLIVAFWPFAGLLLSAAWDRIHQRKTELTVQLVVGGLILLTGSLIAILA